MAERQNKKNHVVIEKLQICEDLEDFKNLKRKFENQPKSGRTPPHTKYGNTHGTIFLGTGGQAPELECRTQNGAEQEKQN